MSSSPPKGKGLRIASRCSSIDEFIAVFRPFCTAETIFIATKSPRPKGTSIAFAITLKDGKPVIRGRGTITQAYLTKNNDYKRPGMLIRFDDIDPSGRVLIEELSSPPPASEASASDGDDEGESTKVDGGPDSDFKEERTKGGSLILPANPFGELGDASLEAFVECTLYEETGEFLAAPESEGEEGEGASGDDEDEVTRADAAPSEGGDAAESALAPPLMPRPPTLPGALNEPAQDEDEKTAVGAIPNIPPIASQSPPLGPVGAVEKSEPAAVPVAADAPRTPAPAEKPVVAEPAPTPVPAAAEAPSTPAPEPAAPQAPPLPSQGPPTGAVALAPMLSGASPAPPPAAVSAQPSAPYPQHGMDASVSSEGMAAVPTPTPPMGTEALQPWPPQQGFTKKQTLMIAGGMLVVGLAAGAIFSAGGSSASSTKDAPEKVASASNRTELSTDDAPATEEPELAVEATDPAVEDDSVDEASEETVTDDGADEPIDDGVDEPVAEDETPDKEPTEVDEPEEDPPEDEPVAEDMVAITQPGANPTGPCSLSLDLSPADAVITANGERQPDGQFELLLPCGETSLRFDHPRYQRKEQSIDLVLGEPSALKVRLSRPMVALKVLTFPKGAVVQVNNRKVGKTPLTTKVPAFQKARIKVSSPGYKTYSKQLYVKKAGTIKARLQKARRK